MAAPRYLINNELTENAHMTTEMIKKCTFMPGEWIAVRSRDNSTLVSDNTSKDAKQYHNKYIEVTYPNGEKSASIVLPGVVMHSSIHDYYGKPSIYVGVPQTLVKQIELKLSNENLHPVFQDKKVLSDATYWWVRCSRLDAEDEHEYIRVSLDDGDEYFAGFQDFFRTYPTCAIANITCSLKVQCETKRGEEPTGKEQKRAGLLISMFNPIDSIDVPEPSTGIGQKSIAGKSDKIRPGLSKFRRGD